MRRLASLALGLVLAFGLSSIALGEQGKSAQSARTKKMSVVVESIDLNNRLLHVQDPLGNKTVVQVDKHAKNLSQLKVGDRIFVEYREALAVAIAKSSQLSDDVQIKKSVSRAKPGEKPAGTVRKTTEAVVQIESIDQPNHTVTFKGPDGESRTVKLESPKVKQFLKELNVGDAVHITYTEAVAYKLMPRQE
jgi:hypothetical protein